MADATEKKEKDWRLKEIDGLKKLINAWRLFFLILLYAEAALVVFSIAANREPFLSRKILILWFLVALFGWYTTHCLKFVKAWEKGVVFFMGKCRKKVREPGPTWIWYIFEKIKFVPTWEQVVDPPPQNVITQDNIEIGVNPVIYFKATKPRRFVIGTKDAIAMIVTLAETTIRDACGNNTFDTLRAERSKISEDITKILNEASKPEEEDEGWGIRVTRVKLQGIDPPSDLLKAIEKKFVATKEKEAKIETAEGDKRKMELEAEGERAQLVARAEGNAKELELKVKALGPDGAKQITAILVAGLVKESDKFFIDPQAAGLPLLKEIFGGLKDQSK